MGEFVVVTWRPPSRPIIACYRVRRDDALAFAAWAERSGWRALVGWIEGPDGEWPRLVEVNPAGA